MSTRQMYFVLIAAGVLLAGLELRLAVRKSRWKELDAQVTSLYQQGKYAEAIPAARAALRVAEETFGPDHPKVATDLNNLAMLYRAQGKYAQAEPLYKRSLAIDERALGPDHPKVAYSLASYAVLLKLTNRKAEGDKLEARAKAIQAKQAQENRPN